MSSCSREGSDLSPEDYEKLSREHLKKVQAEELRNGRRAGRRWAARQAATQQLKNLELHRDSCHRQSKGSWKSWFEEIRGTRGYKVVADHLASVILGEPVDDVITDEFWEGVFDTPNPFLERQAEYFRGFAEGALKVWEAPEGKLQAAPRRSPKIGDDPRPADARYILCVDQDDYCKNLHAELRRTGGRVIHADWENAAQKLVEKKCDLAIFDVRAYPSTAESFAQFRAFFPSAELPWQPQPSDPPTPDRYGVIREISESAWGREHPVIVYSALPAEQFQELAASNGIDVTRIRYCCKGRREVPPELDCIRQQIAERPALIGFYFSDDDTPQAITQELIDDDPQAYALIELYMMRLLREAGTDDERPLFDALPSGFLIVYLLWRFFSDVDNGGFEQFMGNALSIDESGALIVETVDSLRRVGLINLAEMTQEAIRLEAQNLPESVVKAGATRPRRKTRFKSRYPANHPDPVERQIDALTVEFNAMDYSWGKELEAYVKKHPEEFIHGPATD